MVRIVSGETWPHREGRTCEEEAGATGRGAIVGFQRQRHSRTVVAGSEELKDQAGTVGGGGASDFSSSPGVSFTVVFLSSLLAQTGCPDIVLSAGSWGFRRGHE